MTIRRAKTVFCAAVVCASARLQRVSVLILDSGRKDVYLLGFYAFALHHSLSE